ncbi:MAG: MFS transporter [Streptosporangiales bacterium]|nr:MFS transporter [Streptosporangiales bacterium]
MLATGFTLGLAPAGYLADRPSRKAILLVSVLLYSLGTLAIPLAVGFADMSAYRLLSGIGEGVQATALYAAIGAFFFHRRAVAAGVVGSRSARVFSSGRSPEPRSPRASEPGAPRSSCSPPPGC